MQGNEETGGQTEPEQNSSEATGESGSITNDDGNADNPKKDGEQKKLTYRDVAMNGKPGGSDGINSGFRHTSKQRRDIQRGLQVSQNFLANQKDICGASEGNHRITSAEKQGTTMVYVGRLNSNTTEDDLRAHLHDIEVNQVADVVKLRNKRHGVESSFCVSLNNLDSAEKIFRPQNWPSGIIVRPFRAPRRPNDHHRDSNYRRNDSSDRNSLYRSDYRNTKSQYRSANYRNKHQGSNTSQYSSTDYHEEYDRS